jgi:hypothetical protein
MALTTAAEQTEVITTIQSFPGPNKTLMQSKNILCALDIEVNGNPDNMPSQYKAVDMAGYFDLGSLTAAGDQATLYVGTIFDKAAVGSMYRQITTDANGVVTGAKLYLKTGTGATAASWSALDMTAIVVV